MTTELASKSDLKKLRGWATGEFADVRREMHTGFADVRAGFAEVKTEFARVRTEIADARTESIRWMDGLFIAQISTMAVLLRLFK